MSVLQRTDLEQSPLADLHAIAAELGIESYRGLRRDALIGAIIAAQGGDDDGGSGGEGGSGGDERPATRRRRRRGGRSRTRAGGERDEQDGGGSGNDGEAAAGGDSGGDAKPAGGDGDGDGGDGDDDLDRLDTVTGVLDVLANGSGFLRGEPDVYVSPAQIRRCELRAGDEVAGRVRPARRNERHPSLVRVEQVNGGDVDRPEQRARFEQLTATYPDRPLNVGEAFAGVALGKGARAAISGDPGAGASRLLQQLAATLGADDALTVSVVLVGVRPEEVTQWRRADGVAVVGGSFDEPAEAQAQAAELAVERAKRVAERGGDAVVLIDTLEALPQASARRLFGAARRLEEGGSLTVIAATGSAVEPVRQAGTLIALDAPGEDGAPRVSVERSSTLRADLLG